MAGLRDEAIIDLNVADPVLPSCPMAFLAEGPWAIRRAERALAHGVPLEGPVVLLPPVPAPEKIVGVGLNYVEHTRETNAELPTSPIIFNKLPTALSVHEQPIVLPKVSQEIDYEGELVAVVGIGGRHIPVERAMEHIAAYCCGNDVTARDWQFSKPGNQWLLGKSFDTFSPFGPWLVTADEIPDPQSLRIRLRLNGRVMQDSNTERPVFSIAEIVSYVSGVCTLRPGDLIFTGTPSGTGFVRKPPIFLRPGDVVEVEIDRIGVLRNPVVAEV